MRESWRIISSGSKRMSGDGTLTGPSADLVLRDDEVHLWTTTLNRSRASLDVLAGTLAADERERADRFRFERDRRHFIAGRGMLRMLLARYLGTESQALEFRYGEAGKPELSAAAGGVALRFNCSHSRGVALYGVVRRRRIGVDIEATRPLPEGEQIVRACFSAREKAVLRSLPSERRQEAFFNGWTRKEAYVKAIGSGLTLSLEQIEVAIAPEEPPALLSIDGDPEAAATWSMEAPPTRTGYAAALAVERGSRPLTVRHRVVP